MFQYVPKSSRKNIKTQHDRHLIEEYEHEDDFILDKYTICKGVFANRFDFVVTYLLASIGLGNVLRFPKLVFTYGGTAFIILYLSISLCFGIPMFIVECGLSQFYSVGESKVFRVVPFFQGLGWTIYMMNLLSFVSYSISIEWHLNYFAYLAMPMFTPWLTCMSIDGIECRSVLEKINETRNDHSMTPSTMFFEFEVKGSRRYSDGSLYTFYNALNGFRKLQLFLILLTWGIAWLVAYSITKMYLKLSYIMLATCSLIMIILTIKSLFLSGSIKGIYHCLSPNFQKLFSAVCLKETVTQVMFSLCITKSCGSFAGLNSFKFNFIESAFFIILSDFSFSILATIFIFSNLGYLSNELNADIHSLYNLDFTFVGLVDVSVLNHDYVIWTFLFMFMVFFLGITTLGVVISASAISLLDLIFDRVPFNEFKKFVVTILTCLFIAVPSLFFSLNGSHLYLDLLNRQIDNFTTPIIMLCEIILIQTVYGARRFRLEIKMMTGHTYNIIWVFFSLTLVPALALFAIIHSIYQEFKHDLPLWSEVVSFSMAFIPFFPILISFVLQFQKNYHTQVGLNIIKNGFVTPEHFGPYYKRNWLLSKYYQRKLVSVRKDPEFLKTIPDTENITDILARLRKMYVVQPKSPIHTTASTSTL